MSTCSVEQDEEVVRRFCKTPGTPTKAINQTPRRSSRKRSLFQPSFPTSPAKSDDLGPMSPLSITSNESCMSYQSPCFSPNGKFTTPPTTPNSSSRHDGLRTREVDIKSSVFPSLKIDTPKSRREAATPRRSLRFTSKKNNSVTVDDILRDLTTPPKSSPKMNRSNDELATTEDEADLSENLNDSTPRRSRSCFDSVPKLRFGIKPISSESFYGPGFAASEARSRLFIDSLGSKAGIKKRSLSIESISSNKSFVSGSGRQNRKPRSGNQKEKRPHVGVWHGVKKPKKMKFSKSMKKPLISPKSRVEKALNSEKEKVIHFKTKRLLQEKPARKAASKKKRSESFDENEVIDSFPHSLIKRKKLPSVGHSSSQSELNQEADIPDSKKKFMKHRKRDATVTLLANLRLQYTNGLMKLETPKKRRKLYSGKAEEFNDFCDEEEKISDVKQTISNILNELEDDKFVSPPKLLPTTSQSCGMTGIQVLQGSDTEGNSARVAHDERVSEIENDSDNGLKIAAEGLNTTGSQSANGVSDLEKTGSILSEVTNVITNCDLTSHDYKMTDADGANKKTDNENMFPLFYKRNWNKSNPGNETTSKNSVKKKSVKIPDDQYLLDAGQKSIGIVTCQGCGVMYQTGDFADEAMHRNFHNHLPELRFTGWTNERVVGRYADGRVIMIVSSDPKSWWHKVKRIVDIVDQELGFAEGSVDSLHYKTVYLFINEKVKQIVGCLIAEGCKEGYKMFPPLEGVDVDSCSKDPSPCKVGISRVWTALNHRRRGVAKRMIDCMRRTFLFGEIVPMDLIAFSVPSPSGKLLAQNVTGKLDFLVYGFV